MREGLQFEIAVVFVIKSLERNEVWGLCAPQRGISGQLCFAFLTFLCLPVRRIRPTSALAAQAFLPSSLERKSTEKDELNEGVI